MVGLPASCYMLTFTFCGCKCRHISVKQNLKFELINVLTPSGTSRVCGSKRLLSGRMCLYRILHYVIMSLCLIQVWYVGSSVFLRFCLHLR